MSAHSVVLRPGAFDSVKVFTASRASERIGLGELVTVWRAAHPDSIVTDIAVTQSSDSRFHCVTIIVFFRSA